MSDWLSRIASVAGREIRLGLWTEALRGLPPGEGAELLDRLVHAVIRRDSQALTAYFPLLDLPELTIRVGAGALSDILVAAREADLDACLYLLEDPGGRAQAGRPEPPLDPLLDSLSLGQRKTVARGLRGYLLERILKDPDPRVIREVLRNPRLREQEVLAIASRRPCPPDVFWLLVRAEAWISRLSIRRAVALNPSAPPRLVVALLPSLPDTDLKEIAAEPPCPATLRAAAEQVLAWRGGPIG